MINIESIVRSSILELQPYLSARDTFNSDEGIFLDANENPFGTLNRYPDPYQKKLKKKLAGLKGVRPNNIFIGNGSDEVIDLAFRIFCDPGIDKALIFPPTYGMYEVSAAINTVQVLKLPLTSAFQIDTKKLKPYLKNAGVKLIFICSPNNPTGNVINRKDIEFILSEFSGIVLIDEAYVDFAKTDSTIKLINQYNNLIVSQTFSKAWGLASARVGTAYAHPQIIELYNKVKPPYNVSTKNQQAIINALNNIRDLETKIDLILSEKERLRSKLSSLKMVKNIFPSDSNFLLVEVNNANLLYEKLLEKKIIIRNRSSQINNCLRISIGSPEENDKLINTLKIGA